MKRHIRLSNAGAIVNDKHLTICAVQHCSITHLGCNAKFVPALHEQAKTATSLPLVSLYRHLLVADYDPPLPVRLDSSVDPDKKYQECLSFADGQSCREVIQKSSKEYEA